MSNRFFISGSLEPESNVELPSTESHHITHVLRGKTGDEVVLFNDTGFEFLSQIVGINRKCVTVQVGSANPVCRELDRVLIVGIPFPKGDRQKVLVEKLTELGVTATYFLTTNRTSVKGTEKTVEKLSRYVIEASKQCGRNRLMQMHGPVSLNDFFQRQEFGSWDAFQKQVAHPYQSTDLEASSHLGPETNSGQLILIGPEGGFDESEIKWLRERNVNTFHLGKSILRMETAAIAAASLLGIQHSSQ